MQRFARHAVLVALCACSSPPAKPPVPPAPPGPADPFAWLPADTVSLVRAPGAGVPMIALVAGSKRRPPCVDALLVGIRESYQLQRSFAEPMAGVAVGKIDRDRFEACTIQTVRAVFDIEATARRDGAFTTFESRGGSQTVGFAADRVVLAETDGHVQAILAPARTLRATDPLGALLPRLPLDSLGVISSADYVRRWTQIPSRGVIFKISPKQRGEARIVYGTRDQARRARDALVRAATSDGIPPALKQVLGLLQLTVDGTDVVFDPMPIFDPKRGPLLDNLARELADQLTP